MKIETSNGYVLVRETITRKIARDYKSALLKGTHVTGSGEMGELNALNIDEASEALLLGLVEQVVVVADGKDTFVDANRDWLDNLLEDDFKKLETAVLAIKNHKEEDAKK